MKRCWTAAQRHQEPKTHDKWHAPPEDERGNDGNRDESRDGAGGGSGGFEPVHPPGGRFKKGENEQLNSGAISAKCRYHLVDIEF
jgi:hypothetical protein